MAAARTVIVGASLAGLNAATSLRALGWEGELTILGAEPFPPYDRPPLSKELLTGDMEPDDVGLHVPDGLDAEWLIGQPATGLDLDAAIVRTDAGDVPFDQLVIATGSAPRRLPQVDPDGERIFELRGLREAVALRAATRRARSLVIIGAGFIGVEVASAARALGLAVTIVSLDPPLAAAGAVASKTAAALLAANDVTVHSPTVIESVRTRADGVHVEIADGLLLEADLVVVAVGAVPELDWLAGSGIPLDGGVRCEASLQVEGRPGIVAAGDVARWPNPLFGGLSMRIEHWSNAIEQGTAAARTLVEGSGPETAFAGLPSFWSDHFGTRLQSIGLPRLADRFEAEGEFAPGEPFTAGALRGDVLVGAVTYGQPRKLLPFRRLLRQGVEVSADYATP